MHLGYYLGGPSLTKKLIIYGRDMKTLPDCYITCSSLGKRLHMPCRRGALHSVLEAKER